MLLRTANTFDRGKKVAQAASAYLGEQRRRSTRLEQASPVIIRGVDLLGQPFEERTSAQNLSFHGCRYASKHHLPRNTWITLEVPSGDSRGDAACVRARVAWIQRPQTLRDLFQVGVELEKGKNVWGVAPPSDWNTGAVVAVAASVIPAAAIDESAPQQSEHDVSLEVYLQMALAHTNRELAMVEAEERSGMESTVFLGELRQEMLVESQRIIAEARAVAEEMVEQKANELRDVLASNQQSAAEASHRKWLEELEHGKVDAKAEIVSALTENMSAQLANFQEQVRDTLTKEWAEKLSHASVEFSSWQTEAQMLREEVRATAAVNDKHIEERFTESLTEIRRELEALQVVSATPDASTETAESGGAYLLTETDTARAQWNELLESSLDNAAQRFNERVTSSSQELLRRTEQDLARRVTELQRDSKLAAETSRTALGELKVALEAEVSRAKAALGEIEQTAGRFSEYSRQLEAASQDSLNDLRQRLESSVVRQCAELDRHVAELEGKFSVRAEERLERMSRETVERCAEEIGAKTASRLERAKRAAEELAAREEQAEGILRIHRERLRQVSEQVQREGAAHLTTGLAAWQKDLASARAVALAQWATDLETSGVRATEAAAAALAKETARQLVEWDAQLLVKAQQAVDSAQERMHKGARVVAGKFRNELDEIEASQLVAVREKFEVAAQEQLDSIKNEITKAAERAAATFGEVIAETSDGALRDFSAASELKTEEGRARLVAAAESALQGVQNHTQNSFEHFQEQMAIQSEQALKRASETLEHQTGVVLESLRTQGEARLAEWSEKQQSLSEQRLDEHNERLHAASESWVENTLERLDARSEEHIDAAIRATESAVRRACADVFDSVAQAMKRQMQGALELRPAVPAAEQNSQEQRASA